MKKSELSSIVSDYKSLCARQTKNYDHKIHLKILELRRRYYHETGSELTD